MEVITVNVGQGALAIVRHDSEALIIDSRIPPTGDETVAYVKGVMSTELRDHRVRGLILTGFDNDHSDVAGVGLVLNKYRPDWVMYPKYYKDTEEASKVFELIEEQVKERASTSTPLNRISVRLDNLRSRLIQGISDKFECELFSPHTEDMDSSNNSGIVIRLRGRGPGGFSYLVTGDTETARWDTINRLFGSSLKSDVMAAPHHGSKNGVHPGALLNIAPNTVLISAGVDNQYDHPDSVAVQVYSKVASHVFGTMVQGGKSLATTRSGADFSTRLF
jgi:beta-lactamase superfamily II metal-dependent hydrolase